MLCGKKLGIVITDKIWGKWCSFSHKFFLKIDLLLTLLKKSKHFFSSEVDNILAACLEHCIE